MSETFEARIRRAITDPEALVPRLRVGGVEVEPLDRWQARAVIAVIGEQLDQLRLLIGQT